MVDIYCPLCYGRGKLFFQRGSMTGLGPVQFKPCKECNGTGKYGTRSDEDPRFAMALEWFKSSEPPNKAFKLFGREIIDPVAYWLILNREVNNASSKWDNAAKADIIAIWEMFGDFESL